MNRSTNRMGLGRGRLAVSLMMAVFALGASGGVAQAAADKNAPKLSRAVVEKLKPAQDAIQAKDYGTAVRLSQEGLAVAKTAGEKETALRMLLSASVGGQDYRTAAGVLEQLNNLGTLPASEVTNNLKLQGQMYLQLKDYDKGATYLDRWIKAKGSATADDNELLAQAYMAQRDCKNALPPLERAYQMGGATASRLKQLNYCYYQAGSLGKRRDIMEELAKRYPKADYYQDLISIYQEANADDRLLLNVYRLALDKGYLKRGGDYLTYADAALSAGAPAEAQRVLEKGFAAKAIKEEDRNTRLLTQAKSLAADDKKLLPQLDKEARAGKNGEADVKLGLAYLGFNQWPEASEAIARGLEKGKVKRIDDANMMLGIALAKQNKNDAARKAFEAAKADPRMSSAAELWLASL